MRWCIGIAVVLMLSCTQCIAQQTDYVLFGSAASEKSHAFKSNGATVQKCGGPVGLRQEYYQCRVTPVIVQEPRNLALNISRTGYPKPSASSTSVQYDVWAPLDGGDPTWTNEAAEQDKDFSNWDLDFGKPIDVGKIVLKTWTSYTLTDFDLYAWNDKLGDWEARPFAQVRGNKEAVVTFPGLDLTSSKLRAHCINGPPHQAIYRRIQEFEVYPPPATISRFTPKWMTCLIKVPTSGKWTLEVQEVNDDKSNGDTTKYKVLVDGKLVHMRDFADEGPGLMTYFVDVAASGKPYAEVTFRDTSGYGMRIRSIRAYKDFERYCRASGFAEPMICTVRAAGFNPGKGGIDMEMIDRWLKVFEKAGSRDKLGFVCDFAYLQKGPEAMKQYADAVGKLAMEKQVKLVLGFPTTWAYSPLGTPDGKGKTFRAIEYQQIAYSKFDNYHDPGLKEYMDSCKPGWYDVHYGLTTPNHWSSVPWLTMNSPTLNAARCKGLKDTMGSLNPWLAAMEQNGMGSNLIGIVGEDEPVYWTKIVDVFEDGYGRVNNGVARTDMLMDFNWGVIQDAEKDGVKLDPADGLDMKEKWWLHRNLAHFNEMLANAIRSSIKKEAIVVRGSKIEFPKQDRASEQYVYWTGGQGYPLNDKYHPTWESSVFPQSGVGLGGGPEPYLRARELGRTAATDIESHNRADTTIWLPVYKGLYENGCKFTHHTNQGEPENWGPVAEWLAKPTPEMDRKRMESLLIITRRSALNLIEELRDAEPSSRHAELGSASTLVAKAKRLIDKGDYKAAYEEALKAKSISLPAIYRVEKSGELWPHGISVEGACEIAVHGIGSALRLQAMSIEPLTLTISKLKPGTQLRIRAADGSAQSAVKADSKGIARCKVPAGGATIELSAAAN